MDCANYYVVKFRSHIAKRTDSCGLCEPFMDCANGDTLKL